MGLYKDSRGINCFSPDDTDETFYIPTGWMDHRVCISDIIEKAKEKWPDGYELEDLNITAEYIHTDCLGYDLYDAGDYTNYIKITRIKKGT